MKTKRHTLIVLLVFVLAAGAALALLTHANQKAEQAASEAEDGSIPLLDVTTATLESVSIQYGGEAPGPPAPRDGQRRDADAPALRRRLDADRGPGLPSG